MAVIVNNVSEISHDAGPIRDGVFPSRTDEGISVKTGCRVLRVLVGLRLLCLARPAPDDLARLLADLIIEVCRNPMAPMELTACVPSRAWASVCRSGTGQWEC
ncbi:hypothetical protein ABZ260_33330 [Streptosporangium sp. NPDC006013]|uniref:hypothetical protein n=1 Tax=Streptosporangium sp. NPDC006013 TaxID=3155596 RepID=UPI0033A29605